MNNELLRNYIPDFLLQMLDKQYGKDIKEEILKGYFSKRYVTFRVNRIKTNIDKVEKVLIENNIEFEKVSWFKDAFIIKDRLEEDIQRLDVYRNGEIYLQSLSSMLPPIILEPNEGEDILDMTAAPGGKTTQISSMTENKANITACEKNKIRAEKLKYNIEMQGANRVFIMIKDARNIEDFFSFDKILLDVPCSGSGTLNANDSNIEKYFSKELIDKSSKIQLSLLRKATKIIKPGKEIVYSTCSILDVENEKVINNILKEEKLEIVPIEFDELEKIPMLNTNIPGTICIKPTEMYEGFFVAKLRKKK